MKILVKYKIEVEQELDLNLLSAKDDDGLAIRINCAIGDAKDAVVSYVRDLDSGLQVVDAHADAKEVIRLMPYFEKAE